MYRLIYKSRCPGRISWELINDILNSSQELNARAGITGVLMATNSHFLQVLEGPLEEINQAFIRIARDPRHENVQLVSFGCVESRLFGDWAMHGIGVFDFNAILAEELKIKFGEEGGEVRFPTTEWQVLSMIYDIRISKA